MAAKKVLVTGASGFIGGYVVRELLKNGRQVVAFDRRGIPGRYPAKVEVFLGDVRDSTATTEAMAQVDSWIHLAGILGTQETIPNPRPAVETNVFGALNMLEAAVQYGLPGVNISVGNWFEQNAYSVTKHTAERFCEMYRLFRSAPVVVVRAYNAYGPRQALAHPYGPSKVRKIVPTFVARTLHSKPIQVYGDGLQVMDMIYVQDVATILVKSLFALEQRALRGTIVEAGTGRRTTVLDVAREVIRAIGQGSVVHLPMRPGESPDNVVLANPTTLDELGISSEQLTTLEAGLAKTVSYYRRLFGYD
jgi:nucleoside-diphosphate-sugar epimerase